MKRLNSLLLGLGLAFLGYLVWRIGPRELWHQVSALGWGISLLILAEGMANLMHTAGWRQCIDAPCRSAGWWRLFQMAMAGYAINYLTPSASVGGELSRASLLAASEPGAKAVSSVLLDKLMTGVAHLLLILAGSLVLLWRVKLPFELWLAMATTTALLAAGMTVFVWLQKEGKLGGVCRWLTSHRLGGRLAERAARQISEVDRALSQFYQQHPVRLALSVGWHVAGHAVSIVHAWLFLSLLHQSVAPGTVIAAGILSLWFDLLTFVVPMNLGTLEGSRILVFRALGCQVLLGLAFGVAVRMAQLFWACFGLASYALMASAKSAGRDATRANRRTRLPRRLGCRPRWHVSRLAGEPQSGDAVE